jgi:hypothetical protein
MHHAMKTYGGVEVCLSLGAGWSLSGQFHAPAALLIGEEPLVPIE